MKKITSVNASHQLPDAIPKADSKQTYFDKIRKEARNSSFFERGYMRMLVNFFTYVTFDQVEELITPLIDFENPQEWDLERDAEEFLEVIKEEILDEEGKLSDLGRKCLLDNSVERYVETLEKLSTFVSGNVSPSYKDFFLFKMYQELASKQEKPASYITWIHTLGEGEDIGIFNPPLSDFFDLQTTIDDRSEFVEKLQKVCRHLQGVYAADASYMHYEFSTMPTVHEVPHDTKAGFFQRRAIMNAGGKYWSISHIASLVVVPETSEEEFFLEVMATRTCSGIHYYKTTDVLSTILNNGITPEAVRTNQQELSYHAGVLKSGTTRVPKSDINLRSTPMNPFREEPINCDTYNGFAAVSYGDPDPMYWTFEVAYPNAGKITFDVRAAMAKMRPNTAKFTHVRLSDMATWNTAYTDPKTTDCRGDAAEPEDHPLILTTHRTTRGKPKPYVCLDERVKIYISYHANGKDMDYEYKDDYSDKELLFDHTRNTNSKVRYRFVYVEDNEQETILKEVEIPALDDAVKGAKFSRKLGQFLLGFIRQIEAGALESGRTEVIQWVKSHKSLWLDQLTEDGPDALINNIFPVLEFNCPGTIPMGFEWLITIEFPNKSAPDFCVSEFRQCIVAKDREGVEAWMSAPNRELLKIPNIFEGFCEFVEATYQDQGEDYRTFYEFMQTKIQELAEDAIPLVGVPKDPSEGLSPSMELQRNFDFHVEQVMQHYYRKPLPEQAFNPQYTPHVSQVEREQEQGPFELFRSTHGQAHVQRVALNIKLLNAYIRKVQPNLALDEEEETLLMLAALFHDSARFGDDVDYWDDLSAQNFKAYVLGLGFDPKYIDRFVDAISLKDPLNHTYNIYQALLHDADCIDIMRCRDIDTELFPYAEDLRNSFDIGYLCIFQYITQKDEQHLTSNQAQLFGLLELYKQMLEELGQLSEVWILPKDPLLYEHTIELGCSPNAWAEVNRLYQERFSFWLK